MGMGSDSTTHNPHIPTKLVLLLLLLLLSAPVLEGAHNCRFSQMQELYDGRQWIYLYLPEPVACDPWVAGTGKAWVCLKVPMGYLYGSLLPIHVSPLYMPDYIALYCLTMPQFPVPLYLS